MKGELINGAYFVLGELKGSLRPGLRLAHSLVTGELVTLALPGLGGQPPTAEALRQEGEVFGEIASPYLQSVVDWDPENVFVAWEYVPAWTMTTVLRAAPPPSVGAVLRVMVQLAHALGVVHSRGAVYRGLHPGRVLVLRDGSAKLASTPDAVLTKRGRLIQAGPPGDTPIRYLAPEQIDGAVDARSDIYSLAAISYELVTGRRIYTNPDPVTLAVEITRSTPPTPSAHRPDVPAEVDDLFALCLARRPEDRPRSISALVALLDKLVAAPGLEADAFAPRLGLHPVAFPLLASDEDRAALAQAVRAPEHEPTLNLRHTRVRPPRQGVGRGRRAAAVPEMALVAAEGPALANGAGAKRNGHAATASAEAVADTALLRGADGLTFSLRGPGMTIGRRGGTGAPPDVDLQDLDGGLVVSREHAALHFHDGAWHVLELRARNGTWVNEERLGPGREMPLRPGDCLRIANIELFFERPSPSAGGAEAERGAA